MDVLAPVLARYQLAHDAGRLLYVSFTTVSDYLWLLRAACECLAPCGNRAVLYLAAAVSDFYIPSDKMVRLLNNIINNKNSSFNKHLNLFIFSLHIKYNRVEVLLQYHCN